MNRRNFICLLGGAAGSHLVDWRQHPASLIFLPSPKRLWLPPGLSPDAASARLQWAPDWEGRRVLEVEQICGHEAAWHPDSGWGANGYSEVATLQVVGVAPGEKIDVGIGRPVLVPPAHVAQWAHRRTRRA